MMKAIRIRHESPGRIRADKIQQTRARERKKQKQTTIAISIIHPIGFGTHIRLPTSVRYVERFDDDFKIVLHVFGILDMCCIHAQHTGKSKNTTGL